MSYLLARRLAPLAPLSTCLTGTASKKAVFGGLNTLIPCRNKWSINAFKGWGKSSLKDSGVKGQDLATSELDDPKLRQQFLQRNMHGGVEDNIFQDEIEAPRKSQALEPIQQVEQKTKENLAMVVDPDPQSRIRWHRNKVIQMVRKNGQLTREERLKMHEREFLHKSHFLPTSVKKLVMLARQISGKPVDEAIMQMTWSKKKMAPEIKYYLEEARDLAIAQRGMGLGKINGTFFNIPQKIKTRKGKWIEIKDPTRLYIAQSWVGRGAWRGKELDYKGRGRMGVIQHPSTSFTILLKEEQTRVREHEEQEAKLAHGGPWVHLPNRRVFGQRPYYSW